MDREELKEVLDELWVCQNLKTLCVSSTEVTPSLLCNIFQRVTQENQGERELLAKLAQRYVLMSSLPLLHKKSSSKGNKLAWKYTSRFLFEWFNEDCDQSKNSSLFENAVTGSRLQLKLSWLWAFTLLSLFFLRSFFFAMSVCTWCITVFRVTEEYLEIKARQDSWDQRYRVWLSYNRLKESVTSDSAPTFPSYQ